MDLGNITMPEPYKPYVPRTFDERIRAAFEVEGTPLERLERALELIDLTNQHLFVVFGRPDDPRIRGLMDIRYNDEAFRPLSDEFRIMAIPTDDARLDAALALAERLDEQLSEAEQPFHIVLLDRAGKKAVSQGIVDLCVNDWPLTCTCMF